MKVYRNGVEIFEIKDYRQTGRFMEVATIDATVKTPTPFEFKIGDYVIFDYNGLTYTIYDVAPAKKQARSGTYGEAFSYELRFKADTEQLAICPFLDLVINDNLLSYTSLPSFTTFENVYGIADRLQANMDSLYPGKWRFDVVQTDDAELLETLGEAMEFSISGESCLEGLKKIYDTWGVSFIHTFEDGINVITLGKSAGTTSAFRYGKGQGLRTVKKNLQNTDQLCTRAYVYGSTRNIPARWYNDKEYIGEAQYAPNLMIPPSKWVNGIPQGAYIDAIFDGENRIEKYGLKIKTFSYDGSDGNKDEIYPSIEKITAGVIRTVKEDLGEEENVPSIHFYPDSERMDMVLEGTKITDDGTATDPGYVLWSDKYNAIVKPETIVYPIAEQTGETKYKLLTLQKSFNLCSFDIVKTSRYQIYNEFNDFVKFKKNDLESTVSAALYLQKPSGASIELRKLIFTDTLEGSLQLPNLEYSLDEVGKYTLVVKFNVSWSVDYVTPQFGDDVTLEYSIPTEYNVVLARGQKILPSDFTIKIKQIGFDINNYTASNGASKSIHVKSGMCAGRTFGIKQCTYSEEDDSWVLLCRRIDDSSVSQRFPNSTFPISKDDQFILININMPDLYVYAAMQRLYDTAYADLEYFSRPQYVIEPEIDNLQMARSPQVIKEGMYMPIEEIDLDYVEDTLIDSVTITNRGTELRTFEVTLRNDKVYNKYAKLASRIAELESSLQQANSNANVTPAAEGTDNVVVPENNGGASAGIDEAALEQYLEKKNYATVGYVDDKDKEQFSSLQSNTTTPVSITVGGVTKTITQDKMRSSLGLGTAAYESKDTFATQKALNETDAEVDEHTKIVNTLQQTLAQATATITELQSRLAKVEDWGFQFTMTPQGSRILVTPHNFVSDGAIAFAGQALDEEFEQKIVLITEDEYNTLVESGQVNETKIYYVY